jgi:hypothetical protein
MNHPVLWRFLFTHNHILVILLIINHPRRARHRGRILFIITDLYRQYYHLFYLVGICSYNIMVIGYGLQIIGTKIR